MAGGSTAGASTTKHPPVLTDLTPPTGIAGTTVTLTGTYLSTETAVHFGKAKATAVTVKGADKLLAVAPPGAGTVAVSVTAPTGTSNTEPFTYDPPVASSLEPARGVAGTMVTVHGTGFSPTASVSFARQVVPGVTVKGPKTITFAVPKIGTTRRRCGVVVHTRAGSSSPLTFVFLPARITITTSSLPGARTTAPYTPVTLGASGGTGVYTWSVAPGLPPGLSLAASTGVIFGRATTPGTYSFKVTAKDGDGATASGTLVLGVTQGPYQILSSSLAVASLDAPYSSGELADSEFEIGPPTLHLTDWLATGLPSGLKITSYWGTIFGTPAVAGTFQVTVSVNWADTYFATRTFTLVVQGFHIATTKLSAFTSTVWAPAGTGPTTLTAMTATGTLHWSASGLPAGLSLNPTTGAITGSPGRGGATVGTHTFTATVTDAGATTSQQVAVLITQGPLTMTTSAAGPAYLDTPYDGYLYADGPFFPADEGYTVWSAQGLPAGLTITGTYGTIYGTPTTAGTSHAVITVSQEGTFFDVVALTLSVSAFHITTSTLARWTTMLPGPTTSGATSFSADTGTTSAYSWSVGTGFPPGLTLTATNGQIRAVKVTTLTGAPLAAGSYHFTVTVRDRAGQSASRSFALTVNQGALQVDPVATQAADQGSAFSLGLGDNTASLFGALSGPGITLWYATGLPPGLTLTSDYGTISGSPTSGGTYHVTARAYWAPGSFWAAVQFTIDVYSPLEITTSSLPHGPVGVPYCVNLWATGGTGTYSWSAAGLPPGLHVTGTYDTICGIPTQPTGIFGDDVQITVHSPGGSDTKSFTLLISANLPILSVDPGSAGTAATAWVAGFDGTAKLIWDGRALPDSVKLSYGKTTLSFTVPAGSGTATVYVLLTRTTPSTTTRFVYSATPGLVQTTPAPYGKTGTRVTLHGSGFQTGDRVVFTATPNTPIGTPATFTLSDAPSEYAQSVTVTSSTTMTIVVPKADTATSKLYVQPPSGSNEASSNRIDFTFAYPPTITRVRQLEEGFVFVTGTGFTTTAEVQWGNSRDAVCTMKRFGLYTPTPGHGDYWLKYLGVNVGALEITPFTFYGLCGYFPFPTTGITITNRFGSTFLGFDTFGKYSTGTPPHPKSTTTTDWWRLWTGAPTA